MFKAKAAVHSGNGRIAAVYVYEVEKPDVRPLGEECQAGGQNAAGFMVRPVVS